MALIIYCVRGQRAHKYCRCVQRIKLSDASRCSRNSWTCLFFKNFKCIIFTGITYFYPVPHNMHTQIRTLSGSHLFTTTLLPTIQVTNTAHSNHIQYVPKVLEQTSKVWTCLGVVSTHAPDAVCLALVCVRLCTSVCVCEPSTVKSNFRQYLSQVKCKLSTQDNDHCTAKTSQ